MLKNPSNLKNVAAHKNHLRSFRETKREIHRLWQQNDI